MIRVMVKSVMVQGSEGGGADDESFHITGISLSSKSKHLLHRDTTLMYLKARGSNRSLLDGRNNLKVV